MGILYKRAKRFISRVYKLTWDIDRCNNIASVVTKHITCPYDNLVAVNCGKDIALKPFYMYCIQNEKLSVPQPFH